MEDPIAEARALRQLTTGVSPSSAQVYAGHIKRFKRWCGSVQGVAWPPERSMVSAYEMSLLAAGTSSTSAKNAAQVAARYLSLLEPTGHSEALPATAARAAVTSGLLASSAAPLPAASADELILASLGLPSELARAAVLTPDVKHDILMPSLSRLIAGLEIMLDTLEDAAARAQGWAA